ncbi:hypothetical protein [Nannocystis pusilla]|uniref:hypothetical protein n=1 Tax=Nannocystis pusilla TaxID=889268 RepID=UPI003B820660
MLCFHHRSLKQSRQEREDERDHWAGERAAAQADRESASRPIDALVAEPAAVQAERDAQAREVVALRADLAQTAGRIEQLEATSAMIRGLRQVGRVEADEPESTMVALHGDAMTTNESEDGRCSVTTMTACASVITGLRLQASWAGTNDPAAPSADLCPSLIMRLPPVLADVCDGRRVLNATTRSRARWVRVVLLAHRCDRPAELPSECLCPTWPHPVLRSVLRLLAGRPARGICGEYV